MLEAYQLVYVVMELVIACLAVAGNTLVCWAVSINSNLHSITNFFVVSLAVADIAVGLLAIPFAIAISFGFCANFYGCLFMACFVIVLTQGSIFCLLAIAVDRYIAIRRPLRYNSLVTGHRARAFIMLCWVLAVVIGLTPMMGWNAGETNASSNFTSSKMSSCPEGLSHCLFEEVVNMSYMVIFNFFICTLLPLVLMLAIYSQIFATARQQLRFMSSKVAQVPSVSSNRSTLQQEVRAAKSLAMIVGLFALCWLPLHIINLVNHLCEDCERPDIWVVNIAIILSHANSVVNPFIYAYRIREFRQTFQKILYKHILRKGYGSGFGGSAGLWSTSTNRPSSPLSKEMSSGGTMVNNFVLDPSPDLNISQDTDEPSGQWTSHLNDALNSCMPNGHQIKRDTWSATQQQLCVMGVSAPCPEESAADDVEIKDSRSCIAFVNVQAFSIHQANRIKSTKLPEVS